MNFTRFLKSLSRPAVTVIALLLVVIVGFFDSMTGPGYSFSAFYLLPVVLTAWYAGRDYAIIIAVTGAAAWLAAGITGRMHHEHTLVLIWNDAMELFLFVFAAYVISALRGRLEREEILARTDHLTGIANRRRFGELADAENRRSRRYSEPFTVIYLDVDNFKTVNDTLGHSEGDCLLRQVAERSRLRSGRVTRLPGLAATNSACYCPKQMVLLLPLSPQKSVAA
jgi:predicted signal transduction protein with EAL and GGDEF domain